MLTKEVITYFDDVISRSGKYMARCPCHDDQKQSLSITAADGITLIHCFAGCNAKDILTAVGLSFKDLYDERNFIYK